VNPVNPVCSTSTPGLGQWREAADRWCSKSSGTPAHRFHPGQGIQGPKLFTPSWSGWSTCANSRTSSRRSSVPRRLSKALTWENPALARPAWDAQICEKSITKRWKDMESKKMMGSPFLKFVMAIPGVSDCYNTPRVHRVFKGCSNPRYMITRGRNCSSHIFLYPGFTPGFFGE